MLKQGSRMRMPARPGSGQRGISLVELMVGITVGLFVAAAAAMLAAAQIGDNRKLMVEAQLMQDLRATMDMVTRELRRSGAKSTAYHLVWLPTDTSVVVPGTLDDVVLSDGDTHVEFQYNRPDVLTGWTGYKLDGGRLKVKLTAIIGTSEDDAQVAGWQDLTDINALVVTAFSVTPVSVVSEPTPAASAPSFVPCPKLCAGDVRTCWPLVSTREYQVSISARSPDNSIQRTLTSKVRVRNDQLVLNSAPVCPA